MSTEELDALLQQAGGGWSPTSVSKLIVGDPNGIRIEITEDVPPELAGNGFVALILFRSATANSYAFIAMDGFGNLDAGYVNAGTPEFDLSLGGLGMSQTDTIWQSTVDGSTALGTWQKVTGGIGYQNGYTDRGGIYAPVQFRKTPENEVQIVGACTGVFSVGVVLFTLPAEFRPNKTVQVAIQGNGADSVLEVNSDGTCKFFNGASGAVGINGRFPLDTLA